ncbi:MAG: redox-sensing transcriptional repressor Rex, partial [Candidatus Omnitrophica bacterium]|nr:redox-sensing transcriptional repressor Rex [Candidatus Omnitrophota bacterium]
DIKNMTKVLTANKIKIAMLAVPTEAAQKVADKLVSSGVTGILNFSSRVLDLPREVKVSNVDMACELQRLIFFNKEGNHK